MCVTLYERKTATNEGFSIDIPTYSIGHFSPTKSILIMEMHRQYLRLFANFLKRDSLITNRFQLFPSLNFYFFLTLFPRIVL